jgi:hypothetical protein
MNEARGGTGEKTQSGEGSQIELEGLARIAVRLSTVGILSTGSLMAFLRAVSVASGILSAVGVR